MTSISARRGLATLLCSGVAAATLVLPAAAYADTLTVADPVGDAVKGSEDDPGFSDPAPKARAVDVVSTRVDYRTQVLVVRVKAVKAARDVNRFVRVKGGGRDTFFYGAGRTVISFEDDCEGTTSVNKDNATYTVKIPARCFGSPAKVRVGLALSRTNRDDFSSSIDDALRDGFPQNADNIKLTRPLARG